MCWYSPWIMYRTQHRARPVKRTLSSILLSLHRIPSPPTSRQIVLVMLACITRVTHERMWNILTHALFLDVSINFKLSILVINSLLFLASRAKSSIIHRIIIQFIKSIPLSSLKIRHFSLMTKNGYKTNLYFHIIFLFLNIKRAISITSIIHEKDSFPEISKNFFS